MRTYKVTEGRIMMLMQQQRYLNLTRNSFYIFISCEKSWVI